MQIHRTVTPVQSIHDTQELMAISDLVSPWDDSALYEFYSATLAYVQTDLLACFDTSKFTSPNDRWQMGLGIMGIFNEILSDCIATVSGYDFKKKAGAPVSQHESTIVGFAESVMRSMVYDPMFHYTILNILSLGISQECENS
jgi:hypothetical protein